MSPSRPIRAGTSCHVAIKVATEAPSLHVYAGHSAELTVPGVQPDSSAALCGFASGGASGLGRRPFPADEADGSRYLGRQASRTLMAARW